MTMMRRLRGEDLGGLMELSVSAGWNQTEEDWGRMLKLAPEGCWGVEAEGRLAASATAVVYGGELAWIGMVLTLPEFRGRGFASGLLGRLLEDLRAVPTVKLDATELGRPVYERLGFVEEYVVERWRGTVKAGPVLEEGWDYELDRAAFGADRRGLLDSLGRSRPGRVAGYVGPVVSRTAEGARRQVEGSGAEGVVYWDVPEPNGAARELAKEMGFEPVRKLWRMRRGVAIEERVDWVYGLAGFEWG